MVKAKDLCFAYQDGTWIFDHFSLSIAPGEALTILGPSGCGKTTLLYILAGLFFADKGQVEIGGEQIIRPRPRTGLILQDHGLLPWATVLENTRLGITVRGFYGPDGKHSPKDFSRDRKKEEETIRYWLNWLGIDHLRDKFPGQLSRGQRQRAAIARTLVLKPDLLLMDEPFSALDEPIRNELQRVMNGFHRDSGLTLVTVTHDIEEAVVLGERILVLEAATNREARLVKNPCSGGSPDKSSESFQGVVRQLRDLLGEEGG